MAEQVFIQDVADHVGETVAIKGWLYAKTGKGRLQFLQVRDGTGMIQCVVFKKAVTPEVFEAARQPDPGIVADRDRHGPRRRAGAGTPRRPRDGRQRPRGHPGCDRGVSHHAQGAWRRFLDAEPPPVDPLHTPVGRPARAGHGHQGHPRLAGQSGFHPDGHADPDAGRL